MTVDEIIAEIVRREGGYVNDPRDAGGETNWGVTIAVARANGYDGPMRDMPRSTAERIYRKRYVEAPGFDKIAVLSPAIGAELVDTGVNMGPQVAARFLQRALNSLNRGQADYADLIVDGDAGQNTRAALAAFLAKRGQTGLTVMLRALNALQGERYIAISEARPANEAFVYGWLANRVSL